MRKIFASLVALLALSLGLVSAQYQVRVVDGVTITRSSTVGRLGSSGADGPATQIAVCTDDTLAYPYAKASGLRVANMNGSTSAAAFGQYYDAPQPIQISKMRFYAYKLNNLGGPTANLVVEIYNARPDSLPFGAPLRTTTVQVDTNFYGGSLESLQKVAVFANPVVVTGPYLVVVRNNTSNPVGVVINDYTTQDGEGEWLAAAQIGGLWRHSYSVNVSGTSFNCDMLLDPVVSYVLKANFSANPGCVSGPSNVTFTNQSSPILKNRMYNYAAFLGMKGKSIVWDFGDSTGLCRQVVSWDTMHHYAAGGSYDVTLLDTVYGWTKNCAADTTISLGQAPEAQFTQNVTSLTVQFTDQSIFGATQWYWVFGDGTTSTLQNPIHNYQTGGLYQVCLYSSSNCGTDSTCRSVLVSCPPPVAVFSSIANNLQVNFSDWSTGGANAWQWSFGDGTTSTQQNPSHTYTGNGNYLVILRTFNACGMDSSWYWLSVSCARPLTNFSYTTSQLNVQFSDLTSGGATTWAWDFGDGTNSSLQNPSHLYGITGTYQVCLLATNNCGSEDFCDSLVVNTVGVDQGWQAGVQVYPNPTDAELKVVGELPALDHVTLLITDLSGATVKRLDLGYVQSADQIVDVHELAAGSYLLSFQTSLGTVVKRFSVIH